MGAVSVDIYKNERAFHQLNLSDPNVIKWLLLFRDKVDIYFGAKTDRFYDNAGVTKNMNQELLVTYSCLDDLIEKCNFDSRQRALIDLVSVGHSFKDIEQISLNTTAQNEKRRFNRICNMIAEMNNYLWSIWINENFLDSQMKKCTVCKNDLPVSDKFFGKNAKTKDGLQSVCKKCDSLRKKA